MQQAYLHRERLYDFSFKAANFFWEGFIKEKKMACFYEHNAHWNFRKHTVQLGIHLKNLT